MFKFVPFLLAAVSTIVMEFTVVIPHVGGWVEFMKLSDFGILTAAFEVTPLWATVNVIGAVIGTAVLMIGMARNRSRNRY